jgi:hypothetical protein
MINLNNNYSCTLSNFNFQLKTTRRQDVKTKSKSQVQNSWILKEKLKWKWKYILYAIVSVYFEQQLILYRCFWNIAIPLLNLILFLQSRLLGRAKGRPYWPITSESLHRFRLLTRNAYLRNTDKTLIVLTLTRSPAK